MRKTLLIAACCAPVLLALLGSLFLIIKIKSDNNAEAESKQSRQRTLSNAASKPEQKSDAPPQLSGQVVARPQFHYGQDEEQTTGTVFFLRDKKGQHYLITAAHLYKGDEWASMRKIVLNDMHNRKLGDVTGKPLFIGKFTEDSELSNSLMPDMSEDLVIHKIPAETPVKPLRLAFLPAAKDETIWVVGCELHSTGGQQLYPCKHISSTEKMIMIKPIHQFNPDDFSGAPLINKLGEVIGTLNGGNPNILMGTPLSAFRQHGAIKKIEFE